MTELLACLALTVVAAGIWLWCRPSAPWPPEIRTFGDFLLLCRQEDADCFDLMRRFAILEDARSEGERWIRDQRSASAPVPEKVEWDGEYLGPIDLAVRRALAIQSATAPAERNRRVRYDVVNLKALKRSVWDNAEWRELDQKLSLDRRACASEAPANGETEDA